MVAVDRDEMISRGIEENHLVVVWWFGRLTVDPENDIPGRISESQDATWEIRVFLRHEQIDRDRKIRRMYRSWWRSNTTHCSIFLPQTLLPKHENWITVLFFFCRKLNVQKKKKKKACQEEKYKKQTSCRFWTLIITAVRTRMNWNPSPDTR